METIYSKSAILNFMESNGDFIQHDILTDDYKQTEFNSEELFDLFSNLYHHASSKIKLFTSFIEYYEK